MKDDDKTVEILIPVPPSKAPMTLSPRQNEKGASTANLSSVSPRSLDARQSYTAVAIRPSWIEILKQEISNDWTLRLLAVLTILVLSLLVL